MSTGENATYLTPSTHPKSSQPSGPVKPTLLAFHGSGSNSTVHTVQLARLMRFIKKDFEVESLEAPFPSPAGPGVLPVFDGCGPFKRWLPPAEKVSLEVMRSGQSTSSLSPEVESLVRSTVQRIRAAGGRVIGLIGFSQGTKVVAGLLRASEIRKELVSKGEMKEDEEDWCQFDFGVSICASYPPLLMPPAIASKLPNDEAFLGKKITMPSFHVQGKQDEWMWAGQGLIEKHYQVGEGMSEVVTWDMGHHYPVQPEESERIAEWMVGVLKKVEGGREAR